MFEWAAFLADLVVIGGVVYAIRRWKPFKWWLTLGYWFNAQEWGARNDTLWPGLRSCWTRVLPRPVCRVLASFFLLKVESPPELEGAKAQLDHQMSEAEKVTKSWERITARHKRRGWNHHPHGCYDPTNLRWCSQPNCEEIGLGWVKRADEPLRYYCEEHHPVPMLSKKEHDG